MDSKARSIKGAPKPPVTKKESENLDSTALYFQYVSRLKLLSPKDEAALATRIDDHIFMCVGVVFILVKYSQMVLSKSLKRKLPLSLREKNPCSRHPYILRYMSEKGLEGDEGLRSAARCIVDTFNPKELSGPDLTVSIEKNIRDLKCPEYLSWFVSEQAKRDFDEMVLSNLRFVISIARKYHGLPMLDMIQEGNLGLMKAVSRFDSSKGFRFTTYASWWIRHAIGRARADKAKIIRLPVHVVDVLQKIRKAKIALTTKLEREPTLQEISEEADVSVDVIEKRLGDPVIAYSLDAPLNPDDSSESGQTLMETLRTPENESSPLNPMSAEQEHAALHEALQELSEKERHILEHRFGLNDAEEMTLKNIGALHDLSRERIRQLQEEALKKLRKSLEKAS